MVFTKEGATTAKDSERESRLHVAYHPFRSLNYLYLVRATAHSNEATI